MPGCSPPDYALLTCAGALGSCQFRLIINGGVVGQCAFPAGVNSYYLLACQCRRKYYYSSWDTYCGSPNSNTIGYGNGKLYQWQCQQQPTQCYTFLPSSPDPNNPGYILKGPETSRYYCN